MIARVSSQNVAGSNWHAGHGAPGSSTAGALQAALMNCGLKFAMAES